MADHPTEGRDGGPPTGLFVGAHGTGFCLTCDNTGQGEGCSETGKNKEHYMRCPSPAQW